MTMISTRILTIGHFEPPRIGLQTMDREMVLKHPEYASGISDAELVKESLEFCDKELSAFGSMDFDSDSEVCCQRSETFIRELVSRFQRFLPDLGYTAQHINGGAFRQVSIDEWRELGGDGNPICDWHEGIGYVVYDDIAKERHIARHGSDPLLINTRHKEPFGPTGSVEEFYEGDEVTYLRDTLKEVTKQRDHFYRQFRTAWAALTPQSENEKRGMERVLAILKSKQKDAVDEGNGFGPTWSARNKAFKECAEMLRLALEASSATPTK
jgi:hypothetical protein